MFYKFGQNNSGGSFDYDGERGISHIVFIEADSAEEANRRAESIGIYFYGAETGADCDCCGDRWYEADDYDASEEPRYDGETLDENWTGGRYRWMLNDQFEAFVQLKEGYIIGYGKLTEHD